MPEMTDDRFAAIVAQHVKDAKNYTEQLSKDRKRAVEYYDGKMTDTPSDEGRSRVVSRDVRSTIKKVLPSLTRTILGSDQICEFVPVGEGDEENADQATEFVNFVVFPESNGYDAVQDAVWDALTARNGYLRWWRDKRVEVQISSHTGLDEMALAQLVADDSITVLERNVYEQQIDSPQGPVSETFYDVKIRRRAIVGENRLAAVPPENMLISPDALTIDDSPLVGVCERRTRSDLIAMGFDRDRVMDAAVSSSTGDAEEERMARRREVSDRRNDVDSAVQEIDYYDLYVKVDRDEDGIAELWRCEFAGTVTAENMLSAEETDEIPFQDIIVERRAHQREGNSVADDTMDIQQIKTVLLRQTMDNLYWQNNMQPVVQEGTVLNPSSVLNPSFGEPIRVSQGTDARAAVATRDVPFVAQASYGMLEYMDREAQDRTGITDASSGMAPDALQNITAKASSMIEAAGIAQTELMVRTVAERLKKVFRGLLKLTVKYQDKPRVVRLRDKWVSFDPRQWNVGMDVTVNTGLGAGTRERDMMMMQVVGAQQEKLLSAYGPTNNPFVSPDNIWNGLRQGVQATGLRNPEQFFTKPTPEAIQQLQQAATNQPNPQMEKIKADQAKAQADMELERDKLRQEGDLERLRIQNDFDLKRYQIDQELELKRQQNVAQVFTPNRISSVQLGGQPG